MKALAIIGYLSLGLGHVALADDTMRCGGDVIATGDREARVQAQCGAPTRAESHEEVGSVKGLRRHVTVDIWTYDRGPRDRVRVLTFMDGVLRTIDVGGYGSGG